MAWPRHHRVDADDLAAHGARARDFAAREHSWEAVFDRVFAPCFVEEVFPALRVHGSLGLRSADASIFSTMASGNTNAPVIMAAEKLSDAMLADLD